MARDEAWGDHLTLLAVATTHRLGITIVTDLRRTTKYTNVSKQEKFVPFCKQLSPFRTLYSISQSSG